MGIRRVVWVVISRRPWPTVGLIGLLLMASLVEGTGIGFIVPVLEFLGNDGASAPESPISEYIAKGFAMVSIPHEMWSVMLVGFLLFAIQAVFKFFRMTLTAKLSESITAEVRTDLFDNLLYVDLEYIQRKKGSDFINALVTECNRIQLAFLHTLNLIALAVETIAYLILAIFLSWQLVIAAMVLVVAVSGLLKFELGRSKKWGDRLTVVNNDLQHIVIEHLGGIRILRAFGLEGKAAEIFHKKAWEFPKIRFQTAISRARLGTFYEIGMVAGLMGVVFISVTYLHMSTAMLLTFIFVLYRFYPKVGAINKALHQITFAAPGVVNVLEMMEETETPAITGGDSELSTLREGIRFADMSFGYDVDSAVLSNVDFSIPSGQTVAVVGGSGAGKTTLVNLLMRFYDPTGGHVLVDGVDLKNLNMDSWRSAIALVNQDTFLFNDTIGNNIAVGRQGATSEQIVDAAKLAYAHEFIDQLPEGYDTIVGDRGVRLSGGQRQRLALARAVIRDPQILILDEATSELDSRSENLIRQAVEELGASRTIFIIAHRLSTVRHANNIVVMEHGNVVEQGTHEDLLARGQHYAEFLKLQGVVAAGAD